MSSEIIYQGTKVQFIMELLLGSLQYNNLIFGYHLALWFQVVVCDRINFVCMCCHREEGTDCAGLC